MAHTYLIFDTEEDANTAAAKCDAAFAAMLTADGCTGWDTPRQRATDSKWFIKKPTATRYKCSACSEGVKCVYTEDAFLDAWAVGD